MSRRGYTKRFHFKDIRPKDPAVRRYGDWSSENKGFYEAFRNWLKDTGYSKCSVALYSVFARQAIGFIDKPYWSIDPEADLERFWQHLLTNRSLTPSTLADYHKGRLKFVAFWRLRCRKPAKPREPNWAYYTGPLPAWLQEDIREFLRHCQRSWKPDRRIECSQDTLSHLSLPLRWIVEHFPLNSLADLTPQVWFAYLDQRLENGVSAKTTNSELSRLRHLTFFLREHDRPICERFLLVDYLKEAQPLPRDVPVDQLRRLLETIRLQAAATHAGWRRTGRLDLAWFLLMLHCGLRTCEVRSLRMEDIDWTARRIRIEQSKGLKDRIVYLSPDSLTALQAYLEVSGVKEVLPDFLFIYRHKPLSRTYCSERLRTYARKCGVRVTPHALRHSFATLLLNSGAPILTVQNLLGHQRVDTTLGYARLYDGTIAADYYAAMQAVEQRLALPEDRLAEPPGFGQLVALADALRQGMLTPDQTTLVQQLRNGLVALSQKENCMEDVKVLEPAGKWVSG